MNRDTRRPDVRPARIEVHIEEVMLEGVTVRDRARVGAAIREELGRLLREGPPAALAENRTVARTNGGSVSAPSGRSPAATGVQIALAAYEGLRP